MKKHVVAIVAAGMVFNGYVLPVTISDVEGSASSFIENRKAISGNKSFTAYKKAMKDYKKEVVAYLGKNESAISSLKDILKKEGFVGKVVKKLDEWTKKNQASLDTVKGAASGFIDAYEKIKNLEVYKAFRESKKTFKNNVFEYVKKKGPMSWDFLYDNKGLNAMDKKVIRKIKEWRKKS